MTRAIYIDPTTRFVRELMLDDNALSISEIVGYESPSGTMPIQDDSGIKHMIWSGLFQYNPDHNHMPESYMIPSLFGEAIFFGKALLVGYDPKGGKRLDTHYRLEYITKHIRLLTRHESQQAYEDMIERYENMFEL